jgi:transposase
VAHLVERFNADGVEALTPRHGGGPAVVYGPAERARIVVELRRAPSREKDGTATWSLNTLQRALRRAPDGLPRVSHPTILKALYEAGWSWQKDRSWCQTGTVLRKRKAGLVEVRDPDTEEKKS